MQVMQYSESHPTIQLKSSRPVQVYPHPQTSSLPFLSTEYCYDIHALCGFCEVTEVILILIMILMMMMMYPMIKVMTMMTTMVMNGCFGTGDLMMMMMITGEMCGMESRRRISCNLFAGQIRLALGRRLPG